MKDMYIGDFINAEDQKESWEAYVARKKREEEGQMSPFMRFVLVAVFLFAFSYLYNLIVNDELIPPQVVDI
jgi:hypothetical protein